MKFTLAVSTVCTLLVLTAAEENAPPVNQPEIPEPKVEQTGVPEGVPGGNERLSQEIKPEGNHPNDPVPVQQPPASGKLCGNISELKISSEHSLWRTVYSGT